MKKLISNELFKIFHKKYTFILGLFIILQFVFAFFGARYNIYYQKNNERINAEELTKELIKKGDKAKEDINIFIDKRDTIDLYNYSKDYEFDSWQKYIINEDGYVYITCMNRAMYKDNDEEKYRDCENSLNQLLDKIKNSTWKDFVYEYKEDAIDRLNSLKESYDQETDDKKKISIEHSMKVVMLEIDGYKYHLVNEIPIDYTSNSVMIDDYISLAMSHIDVQEDETKYDKYYELKEKRANENDMYSYKYRIDNKLDAIPMLSANNTFTGYVCSVIPIVLIYILLIASNCIVDEFNKGTIKQLLIRPYSRVKIILSKLIACSIASLLFLLFYIVVAYIVFGLAYGFGSYSIPIVLYNFDTNMIEKMSIIRYVLIYIVALLPKYFMILLITVFVGLLIKNEAISVALPVLVYMVSIYLSNSTYKFLKYFPTVCWNLEEFLWGGLPSYKGLELTTSIIITFGTIIIILLGIVSMFKNRDVNNQ